MACLTLGSYPSDLHIDHSTLASMIVDGVARRHRRGLDVLRSSEMDGYFGKRWPRALAAACGSWFPEGMLGDARGCAK